MLSVGLTGNIASGKSIVESYFEKKGISVINADDVTHELIDKDRNIQQRIKKLFENEDILDENGAISRAKIGKIVFSDQDKLEELENILHPAVIKKIEEFFDEKRSEDIVIASVPLLFEIDIQPMFDKTILVCADKKIRLQRLMNRNGYSLEHALERINSQISQEEKRNIADFIIENNNDILELELQINKIIERLRA
ncbi:TPA: dephospho-CoA kinase [Candidatus Spyradomonas excrementavium]|nr:dephospho-CoA kinase [Candidatus Spyradomonas excrementavium]